MGVPAEGHFPEVCNVSDSVFKMVWEAYPLPDQDINPKSQLPGRMHQVHDRGLWIGVGGERRQRESRKSDSRRKAKGLGDIRNAANISGRVQLERGAS